MVRWLGILVAGIFLVASPLANAASAQLDGTWKVSIIGPDQSQTLYYVTLDTRQGKLTGSVPFTGPRLPPSTADDITLQGDRLHIVFKAPQLVVTFEGKVGDGE